MQVETIETDVRTAEKEKNDAEDSIGDTEEYLSGEYQPIVQQLKKIMVVGATDDGIMFKKVNKNALKV